MTHFSTLNKPRGSPPSRKCAVCGKPIRSKNFSHRKPENKVLLCKTHLLSQRVGDANPNFRHGRNSDAALVEAFRQVRFSLAKVTGRLEKT